MSGLGAIHVKVEGLPVRSTDNALPLLHEIRHALDRLTATGQSTTIDLSSIPFSPNDRERLFETLGQGEVQAKVHAFGPSTIRETGYPGVWLVQHMNPHGEELSTCIEVVRVPPLLVTPESDVKDSAAALEQRLEAGGSTGCA